MDKLVKLAGDVLTEGGVIALMAVAMLFILGMMAYTLLTLVKQRSSENKVVSTQATVISELIDRLEELSETHKATSENLLRITNVLNMHDDRAVSIGEILANALSAMESKVGFRDRQIEEIPSKVLKEIVPEMEKIPGAVEEALVPKIANLQSEIRALIQSLDDKLTHRIEEASDKIPDRTAELVREELGKFEKSLVDMLETVKSTDTLGKEEENAGSGDLGENSSDSGSSV